MIVEYTQIKNITLEGNEIRLMEDLVDKLLSLSTKQIGFKKPTIILTDEERDFLNHLKQTNNVT